MAMHLNRPTAALALVLVAAAVALAAQGTPSIPPELSDREFWTLVEELSERDGYFEDENYVSNELGYQTTMGRLQTAIAPGGVYVGVGPEQNFAYVAALRPRIAFVVDIRRQNAMQHLLYKALFELSADRADFLSRLFSRPRPADLDAASSVDALFQAYSKTAPDGAIFEQTMAVILDVLTGRHGFGLTEGDRASIRKVFTAFRDLGPDVRYVFRGTSELHPTYAQMMTAKDVEGRGWSFLASAGAFEQVRLMERRNLIVPVVGDFAGPKALRRIGDYVRSRGAAIDVFYLSNVEPYLFTAGTWQTFYDNVATMPLAASGVFVRAFFGSTSRECAALRPTIRTPVIGTMTPLMDAYRRGEVKSQCDLVTASR
jgi:hypothetical protein